MVRTKLCVCANQLENLNVYVGTHGRESNKESVVKKASLIIGKSFSSS